MASFGYEMNSKWFHYCGGAVVSDHILISAAHCFFHGSKANAASRQRTKVRLGDQNLNDGIDDANTYDIENFVIHPGYSGRGVKFDIAIVYTKSKIMFSNWTMPISLQTIPNDDPNRYANEEVKFTGWGYFDEYADVSNDLREATFKVLPESECLSRDFYYRRRKVKDFFFCAGHEVSYIFFKTFKRFLQNYFFSG